MLLPVRDGAATLPRALRSLRRQTFRSFEVVVVDDGSTDDTSRVLAEWAELEPRIRVLAGSGRGIVSALETARGAARGHWLARMDADDEAHPNRLQDQLALARSAGTATLIGCHVRCAPRGEMTDGARRYERWLNGLTRHDDIVRDIWVECPIAHPTFFLRASTLEEVGGYRAMGWPEDYDLVLRLYRMGARFAKVPRRRLRWWDSAARLSRTAAAYSPEAFRRCKVHHLAASVLRRRDGVVIWGAGPTGKAFSRTLRSAGVRVRAFVDVNPRKIGEVIHEATVLPAARSGELRDALHLAAVGKPEGRRSVRTAMRAAGFVEGVNCVAVA